MKSFNYSIIQLFNFLVILLLAACSNNDSVIKGALVSDIYDKELVYLVPLEGASSKTVDSTLIQGSSFQFKIKQDKQNQIFILRMMPALRLKMQDILVISEQGTVLVDFNENSSASGTPMNETLQQWKDKRQSYNKTNYSLYRKMNDETNETERALIQSEIDNLSKEYHSFIDSLILQNEENPVGKFIGSLEKRD